MNIVNFLHTSAGTVVAIIAVLVSIVSELMPLLPTKYDGILQMVLSVLGIIKKVEADVQSQPKS